MKKYLALGLLLSILLTSCSIDWNDEKEKRIGELEKQVAEMKKDKEDDLFKKKQECASYYDKTVLYLDKEYRTNEKSSYLFEGIFYSAKLNTCLFAIKSFDRNNEAGKLDWWYIIENVLTKELVYTSGRIDHSIAGNNTKIYDDNEKTWKQEIKELKGE